MTPTLTGPFCPSLIDVWKPENGVTMASEADCGPMGRRPYDHASAWRARACDLNGIPTGVAIPAAVADLIDRAYGLRAYPDRAAPLWADARAMLTEAQARQTGLTVRPVTDRRAA